VDVDEVASLAPGEAPVTRALSPVNRGTLCTVRWWPRVIVSSVHPLQT